MVLCSSREIASSKFLKQLAGPPVYWSYPNIVKVKEYRGYLPKYISSIKVL
jgi:hypothetical protein